MTSKRFDTQEVATIRMEFRNEDGFLQDPNIVKFGVVDPEGTLAEFLYSAGGSGLGVIIRDGVGLYHFALLLTLGSETLPYWVRFEGDGGLFEAEEQPIWVRVPNVVITV